MGNNDVAQILEEIANLLELRGENPFRVRAYRNASNTVGTLTEPLSETPREKLMELHGIGKDLADKIATILDTGTLPLLEELHGKVPAGLRDLFHVPGLGPKRVRALHEQLHINSLDDLRLAAEKHRIQQLTGFGAKTERNILSALEDLEQTAQVGHATVSPARDMH